MILDVALSQPDAARIDRYAATGRDAMNFMVHRSPAATLGKAGAA